MEFEFLASKHTKIQKAHMDLKQKNHKIIRVQETLHTIVQRVSKKIIGQGPDVPIEDKV